MPRKVANRLNPRKAPNQLRSAQTVDAILEGAAEVLERHGFDGYTTNQIAARAGVSIGSLYQYFPNKDAVTLALIERESTDLVGEVAAALAIKHPKQAVRAMIRAAVRNQLRRPQLARLLDFEEARLFAIKPTSRNAAVIRVLIEEFLRRSFDLSAAQAETVGTDVIEIAKALTDAGGRRSDVDAQTLEASIQAAVFGYLDAMAGRPR
jgi:AcrR family transcriptional regulator